MTDFRTQAMSSSPSVDPNKTIMGSAPSLNATLTIKPVQCPVCKTFNPPAVMFCVDCGLIFDRALEGDAFGAPAVQLPTLVESGGREHPIRPGSSVIGRLGDITIEDSRLSRRHAQVDSENGVVTIFDLGSTNGSKVNGSPLATTPVTLAPGDKVSLGGLELTFSLPNESAKTQMGTGGKTIGMVVPPAVEKPVAILSGGDYRFDLRPGRHTFGRRDSNTFAIPDPFVSGTHGTIEVDSTGIYLTDTGSTNGTMLNDAKLPAQQRTQLQMGDELRLGSIVLSLAPCE